MMLLFIAFLLCMMLNTSTVALLLKKLTWAQSRSTARDEAFSPGMIGHTRDLILRLRATTSDRSWTDNSSVKNKGIERTPDDNYGSDRSSTSSRRSTTSSSSLSNGSNGRRSSWEDKLRSYIVTQRLEDAIELVQDLHSTQLPSGRDVVYVITETSRRAGNIHLIALPLLAAVPLEVFDFTTEDDVMPMLSDSIKTPNGVTTSYRIVEFLSKKGINFTAKAYSVLVKGFGLQRNEQMVDRLLVDCGDNHVHSDVILFNTAIDAYIRCGHQRKAISLFNLVVSEGAARDTELTATSSSSSSAGVLTKGKKQIADQNPSMREALRKKLMGAEIVIKGSKGSAGEGDNASSAQQLQGVQPSQRVASRSKDYLKTLSTVFVSSQVRPNVRSYNTLLKALKGSGTGSFERCMDIVLTMQRQGISPDSVTINTLVDVSVHSGNLLAAEELLSVPMAVPGVEAYTALISGYATQGNVEEAFLVLEQMRDRQVLPNIFTLTSLMKTCVRREDWQRARDLLAMGDHYLNPPSGEFRNKTLPLMGQLTTLRGSFVIGLCGMALTLEDTEDRELFLYEAQRELLRMEMDGMKPDTATMNAFIQGLCSMQMQASSGTSSPQATGRSRVADALMVLRAMRRERIEPDDYTYSIIFAALGREGFVNEALQLYKTAKRQMDVAAVNALLRAFVSGQDPLQAVKLYEELVSINGSSQADFGHFVPTKYTYTILFVALTKSVMQTESAYRTPKNRFFQSSANRGDPALRSWNPVTKLTVNKESVFRSKYLGTIPIPSAELSNASDARALVVDTTLVSTSNVTTRPPSALTALGRVIEQIVIVGKRSMMDRSVAGRVDADASAGVQNGAGMGEIKPSQPLVYDTAHGRFYEQAADGSVVGKASRTDASVGSGRSGAVGANAPSSMGDGSTDADPIAAAAVDTTPGTGTERPPYGPAPTPAPAPAGTRASASAVTRTTELMAMSPDELLQKLYKTMRYEREIEPDEVMVGALNSLFASQGYNQPYSRPESTLVYYDNGPLNDLPLKPKIDGWRRKTVLSKASAELVFEDLAISGWHPTQLRPILRSCSYPQHQMEELLREGEDNLALKKLRASAASVRIFKKHGWNKMESGWTGFF